MGFGLWAFCRKLIVLQPICSVSAKNIMECYLIEWEMRWYICHVGKWFPYTNRQLHLTLYTTAIHYNDVIMGAVASQIASLKIVYSIVNSGADQRKHQSSVSLAFVKGIHWWPVNSTHKRPVTQKMFPFDDVTTNYCFSDGIRNQSMLTALIHEQSDQQQFGQ